MQSKNTISETEEEEEEEDDESYTPGQSEANSEEDDEPYSGSEASASEEDLEEGLDNLSPAKAMKKQKELRTGEKKAKRTHVRRKAAEKKTTQPDRKKNDYEEKQHPPSKSAEAKDKPAEATADEVTEKDGKKGGKKEAPTFNDRNVDLDLFHSSPTNVIARKVKVSSNLIVTCRNIDQIEGARSGNVGYDFAALTFQRKTNNDKMFEFVVPLALAPRINEAIDHIIEENKKFFKPQI